MPKRPVKKKLKTGPEPERVKIEGDWKKAVGSALEKQRPPTGWPDPDKGRK